MEFIGCTSYVSLFVISTSLVVASGNDLSLGIVEVSSGKSHIDQCASFIIPGQPLPKDADHADSFILHDWTWADGCRVFLNRSAEHLAAMSPFDSGILAVNYKNNCSAVDAALITQQLGGKGLLLVAPSMSTNVSSTAEEMRKSGVRIPTGIISEKSLKQIQMLGERISVKEYAPPRMFYMDYATLIIVILSIGSVALATLWDQYVYIPINGGPEIEEVEVNDKQASDTKNTGADRAKDGNMNSDKEDEKAKIAQKNKELGFAILKIVIILIIITAVQLLLYYFYDTVIYIVYGIFFLITVPATWGLLGTFKKFLPCFSCEIHCRNRTIDVRELFLFAVAVGFYVVWVVLRMESYSWIFQDLLILFTILRVIGRFHLYDLKTITVILMLFTVYFVFIIYVTAFMTSEGKSILEVAIVGKEEKMPMTLRLPQLTSDPLSICIHREAAISLLDVIVPGSVVSYGFKFGSKVGARFLYFFISLIGYSLGVVLYFTVQTATRKPQPALLYMSPCVLLFVTLFSIYRRELREIWNGEIEGERVVQQVSGAGKYNQVAQNDTNV